MPDGIIISIIFLSVAILLYAATRPATYRVERRISINAPPDGVYELISKLKNWELWSPWIRRDPKMHKTYSGAESGVGAVFEWSSSQPQIGRGSIELIESEFPLMIKLELRFVRPVRSWETIEFSLVPTATGTELTWSMAGRNRYIFKLMSMFFEMVEQMVGKDFEQGLSSIKKIAEQEPDGGDAPAPQS